MFIVNIITNHFYYFFLLKESLYVLLLIFYYLASKESFGMPYLAPFTSNEFKNLGRDTIIRGIMTKKE